MSGSTMLWIFILYCKIVEALWKLLVFVFVKIPSLFKKHIPLNVVDTYGNKITNTYKLVVSLYWNKRNMTSGIIAWEFFNSIAFLLSKKAIIYPLFTKNMMFINRVDLAKPILQSRVHTHKSSGIYYIVKLVMKTGLSTIDKKQWVHRRKLLAPTMGSKIIETYLPVFEEQALILTKKLSSNVGKAVDILPLISYCTLDIITETVMGIKVGVQLKEDSEYFESIQLLTACVMQRSLTPWYFPEWLFKLFPLSKQWTKALGYMENFNVKVIEDRKKELLNISEKGLKEKSKNECDADLCISKRKKNISFLDLLLQLHMQEKTLSMDDIRDEVRTFMFAGHDTTATNMSWTLYLLGLHKDIQFKVQNEIDSVLGPDKNVNVTLEHLNQMKYLECVIKESGRLYPAAPIIGRKLGENLELDGKIVPKGTHCLFNIYQIHRDPNVFPDSEDFNPERFLDQTISTKDGFLLFSSGPRGCLGFQYAMLEMKMIMSVILRNFSVVSLIPRYKIIISASATIKPNGGIPLIIKKRSKI